MAKQLALPGHFTALDGWRGICALLVAVYHFNTTSHVGQLAVVQNAYLFVDFFFVLSGFVITYSYIERLASWRDAGWMIWRRFARLWPLHVAVLLGFVLLELSLPLMSALAGVQRSAASAFDPGSSALLSAIPSNLLLLHGMGVHDRLTWNHPSWSISVEFWAYVTFAAMMVAARRWSMCLALLLATISLLVIVAFSDQHIKVEHDLGFFRCLAGFMVGHLVYRLVRAHPTRTAAPTMIELATVVGLIVFVIKAGRTPVELAAPFVFGGVVWLFALERGMVSTVLKCRPLAALGLISYSIYMVHALVIALIHRSVTAIEQTLSARLTLPGSDALGRTKVLDFGHAGTMDALVLAYVLIVLGVAALSWRYIEMPAQRLLNGRFAAPQPKVPAPAERPLVAHTETRGLKPIQASAG